MTTEEARRSTSYGSIVSNLLALRDEVREISHEEAEALERIVSMSWPSNCTMATSARSPWPALATDSALDADTHSFDGGKVR